MFAGSIRSNLTLGNTSYSDEQIRTALCIANADKLVARLQGSLEEDVRESGKILSAGERQLLSFARAILLNPRILVLDEATSSIDTITEALIQDALAKILKERTSIVIAHRLSTIQFMDQIVVLHHGRIREIGDHQELLHQRGLYYRLYQLQYKDQEI